MAIYLIGKIKQKNNGKFALVDAADIELPDGRRLDEVVFATKLSELENDKGFPTAEEVNQVAEMLVGQLSDKVGKNELNGEIKTTIGDLFVSCSQEEYDALVAAGTVDNSKYYMIVGEEE